MVRIACVRNENARIGKHVQHTIILNKSRVAQCEVAHNECVFHSITALLVFSVRKSSAFALMSCGTLRNQLFGFSSLVGRLPVVN